MYPQVLGTAGSWKITALDEIRHEATRELNRDNVTIALRPSHHVRFEGWWPSKPPEVKNVISGICLWDGRWQVEFEKKGKGNPPARRSLAFPRDRSLAYEKIGEYGDRVSKIYLPEEPSTYHTKLIAWQAEKYREFAPETVFYHIPIPEYHFFLRDLERLVGSLPEAHEALDNFSAKVKTLIDEAFSFLGERLHLIDPSSLPGGRFPTDSFLMPYTDPEKCGIPREGLCGIEDIVEVRLAIEAGEYINTIPVLVGVIDVPSPYSDKSLASVKIIDMVGRKISFA